MPARHEAHPCRSCSAEAPEQKYWANDKVHLGPKGHDLVRDVALRSLVAGR